MNRNFHQQELLLKTCHPLQAATLSLHFFISIGKSSNSKKAIPKFVTFGNYRYDKYILFAWLCTFTIWKGDLHGKLIPSNISEDLYSRKHHTRQFYKYRYGFLENLFLKLWESSPGKFDLFLWYSFLVENLICSRNTFKKSLLEKKKKRYFGKVARWLLLNSDICEILLYRVSVKKVPPLIEK